MRQYLAHVMWGLSQHLLCLNGNSSTGRREKFDASTSVFRTDMAIAHFCSSVKRLQRLQKINERVYKRLSL